VCAASCLPGLQQPYHAPTVQRCPGRPFSPWSHLDKLHRPHVTQRQSTLQQLVNMCGNNSRNCCLCLLLLLLLCRCCLGCRPCGRTEDGEAFDCVLHKGTTGEVYNIGDRKGTHGAGGAAVSMSRYWSSCAVLLSSLVFLVCSQLCGVGFVEVVAA